MKTVTTTTSVTKTLISTRFGANPEPASQQASETAAFENTISPIKSTTNACSLEASHKNMRPDQEYISPFPVLPSPFSLPRSRNFALVQSNQHRKSIENFHRIHNIRRDPLRDQRSGIKDLAKTFTHLLELYSSPQVSLHIRQNVFILHLTSKVSLLIMKFIPPLTYPWQCCAMHVLLFEIKTDIINNNKRIMIL